MGRDDQPVKIDPFEQLVLDWRSFLLEPVDESEIMLLKKHEGTGRPLGSQGFIAGLENSLGRTLRRQPPGPKKLKCARSGTGSGS
jgi:putative transposase